MMFLSQSDLVALSGKGAARERHVLTGEEAMKLTMNDHDCCLRCCADERATAEEREFLSYMASLAAARKPVSQAEWLRMQALTGGALSTVTPIQDRPKPGPESNA